MAKKKSSKKGNMGQMLGLLALVLGVATVCMGFLVCVKTNGAYSGAEYSTYTGFQVMFGYAKTETAFGATISTQVLNFSFMATLAFALPLIGSILCLIDNKILKFVGAGLMVAGAVLLFLLPNFVVPVSSTSGLTRSLGVGAIIGGCCAGLGGLLGLASTVVK